MRENMIGDELDAALDRAYNEACRVTKDLWNNTGDWQVSIPARASDSDIIICDAVVSAQKELKYLRDKIVELQYQDACRTEILSECYKAVEQYMDECVTLRTNAKSTFTLQELTALLTIRGLNWQIIDDTIRVRGVDGEGNPGIMCPLGAIHAVETGRVEFDDCGYGMEWVSAIPNYNVFGGNISSAADSPGHSLRPTLIAILNVK